MKVTYILHEEPDGTYWAEVPALPGCMTHGDTLEDLQRNLLEAIEAWLAVDIPPGTIDPEAHIREMVLAPAS